MSASVDIIGEKYWTDIPSNKSNVAKIRIRQHDDEDILFHSPNTNDAKYVDSSPICKSESGEPYGVISSPFHLLDHGYGRTPPHNVQRPSISPARAQLVKRRLMVESPGYEEIVAARAPKIVRKKGTSLLKSSRGQMKQSNRYDTSLGLLTKKFVELLQKSPRGIVDLNFASASLEVQKRRIYDITNVLEGVGILEKRSKNNIQWRGGNFNDNQNDVQNEIEKLEAEERSIDELLRRAENDVQNLVKETRYAYVSYMDLRSIKNFATQTVMVIKAPPNAHLEVPQPTSKSRVEMIVKSESGEEIDVFLCPDIKAIKEEKQERKAVLTVPTTSNDVVQSQTNLEDRWAPNVKADSKLAQAALLSQAVDDFFPGPLQTEDQHSSEADPDSSLCDEPFLSLEPPITGSDYMYSLDPHEGLMDLFDFNF
ncbi:Transcription factor [Nesidiocoris tenuis]|uniref:Transcription factor n=1 Tax=Nesidiocoris tenuis TaxID=355587 RepID=A0ABN7B0E1_9HEMI|nr:Transcription factor [Nesidiocoris tenuis]